jgi:hypothetical protein
MGDLLWEKSYGGKGQDYAKSIINTFDGKLVVAGYTSSRSGDISTPIGTWDYWIIKLDDLGNLLWEKSYGGVKQDQANAVIETEDHGYLICGQSLSGAVNLGECNVLVIKIDSNGNKQWEKSYGGIDWEEAISISLTSDGGYILGCSSTSNDGDVPERDHYNYDDDFWIVKIDSRGNLIWSKLVGGTDNEYFPDVIQTKDGGFIAMGYTDSHDFDASGNHGGLDVFIVKLSHEPAPPQADTSDAVFSIVAPEAEAMAVDMGEVLIGDTKDSLVTDFIKSKGSYPCRIDSIKILTQCDKNFLAFSNLPAIVDNTNPCQAVKFRFMPDKAGLFSSLIHVYTQAELLTYEITGVGVERKLAVFSDKIDFGRVEVTDYRDTTQVLISNISEEDIEITNSFIFGPDTEQFEIISRGGAFTLPAKSERELKLRFALKYVGRTSSQIAFEYTGTGSPALVQLYGEGIRGTVSVSSDSDLIGKNTWNNPNGEISIEVMPNPSGDEVKVVLNLIEDGPTELVITNSSGEEVHRQQVSTSQLQNQEIKIDLSGTEQGAYFISLQTPTTKIDKSFVRVK